MIIFPAFFLSLLTQGRGEAIKLVTRFYKK